LFRGSFSLLDTRDKLKFVGHSHHPKAKVLAHATAFSIYFLCQRDYRSCATGPTEFLFGFTSKIP
jgi:hypothetical protein